MEFAILDFIQTLHTPWLDSFMVAVSSLANKGAIWIVLAAVLLMIPKYRKVGAILACGLVVDLLICNLAVKPLVARMRPCDINTGIEFLIPRPDGWSFPSGHTAASFASASALFFARTRLWIPCIVLAAVIGFSRLYLYVHFPTDVLGGMIVGAAAGWLGFLIVKKMTGRKTIG